jgi:hypothetical protein
MYLKLVSRHIKGTRGRGGLISFIHIWEPTHGWNLPYGLLSNEWNLKLNSFLNTYHKWKVDNDERTSIYCEWKVISNWWLSFIGLHVSKMMCMIFHSLITHEIYSQMTKLFHENFNICFTSFIQSILDF